MVLAREDFVGVIKNAVSGLGLPREIAMVTFPIELFLVESDLGPIEKKIAEFIAGLTLWEPESKQKGVLKPPGIRIDGDNYEAAIRRMNAYFLKKMWGDGLPLVPPTPPQVEWILRGTDLPADTVIGKIMPKGGIATVETLAVSLSMAGGRPEYLPILIAALEAILEPQTISHDFWQATSGSVYLAFVVNGPVAGQIRLNSGFGLIGPNPRYPAGGVIGRAIRLLQQNVGGALPGVGTMAMFGGMRYTNAVFAEDEQGLPQGWEPLHKEYFGRGKASNTVSFSPVSSATNIMRRGTGKETLEQEALTSLYIVASFMKSFNPTSFYGYHTGTPGILIFSSPVASQLADLGWSKTKIRGFLWEHARIPMPEIKQAGYEEWINHHNLGNTLQDPWPVYGKADNLMIVVAGGRHPTHAYWLQSTMAPKVVNKEIRLPENWDKLIAEAENELNS